MAFLYEQVAKQIANIIDLQENQTSQNGKLQGLWSDGTNCISIAIHAVDEKQELLEIVVGIEMVLLTNLIRKATKQNIIPHKIIVKHPFQNPEYEKFLSCTAEIGTQNKIIFSAKDAEQQFISRNDSMWDFFEPELKKRLAEMELNDTFSARVRSALIELLPGDAVGSILYLSSLFLAKVMDNARSTRRQRKRDPVLRSFSINLVFSIYLVAVSSSLSLAITDITWSLSIIIAMEYPFLLSAVYVASSST